jgi:hypothetical protein
MTPIRAALLALACLTLFIALYRSEPCDPARSILIGHVLMAGCGP